MHYVIVDLEMCKVPKANRTKEFRWSNEIIQIGAVLFDDNYNIEDQFMTYVNPQYGRLTSYIEQLTGITMNDLNNAPTTETSLKRFVDWIPGDAIMVQWSENDKYQLDREIKGKKIDFEGIQKLQRDWIDCQVQFTEIINAERIFSLQEALNISDIDYNSNIHDGLVDAQNTAMLFKKMNTEKPFRFSNYYLDSEDQANGFTTSFGDLLKKQMLEIA